VIFKAQVLVKVYTKIFYSRSLISVRYSFKFEDFTTVRYSEIIVVNKYFVMRFSGCIVISVPDKRSRIHEVVVVRRLVTWVLGIWSGEGMGRVEEGEFSLGVT
jgi:hypothetical protein